MQAILGWADLVLSIYCASHELTIVLNGHGLVWPLALHGAFMPWDGYRLG